MSRIGNEREPRPASAALVLALALLLPWTAAGCETTPEKGDDANTAAPAAEKLPPEPVRDRSAGAPPFTPPKPKERPNDPVDGGQD